MSLSLCLSQDISEMSKGIYIPRGVNTTSLSRDQQWLFSPSKELRVCGCDCMCVGVLCECVGVLWVWVCSTAPHVSGVASSQLSIMQYHNPITSLCRLAVMCPEGTSSAQFVRTHSSTTRSCCPLRPEGRWSI